MTTWWSYGVVVRGIKKRSRKPDLHIVSDLDRDEVPNEEKARALAKMWLDANMKAIVKAEATLTYWRSDQAGCQTWEPMNREHNRRISL